MIEEIFNELINRLETKLEILFRHNEIEYIELEALKFERDVFVSQVLLKKRNRPLVRIRKESHCPRKALLLMLIEYNFSIESLPEDLRVHYTTVVLTSSI